MTKRELLQSQIYEVAERHNRRGEQLTLVLSESSTQLWLNFDAKRPSESVTNIALLRAVERERNPPLTVMLEEVARRA